jgi:hypothetical protein
MKVTGHKKLIKQLKDIPKETHEALVKSIQRTVKSGASKARSIVPVVDGDLKDGIGYNVDIREGEIFGFINFYDGDKEDGLVANVVNYGWGNLEFGYQFRDTVKIGIADRHKRAVRRNINKAIKDAVNG